MTRLGRMRLPTSRLGRAALLGTGLLGASALVLSPGGLAPIAARAALAAAAVVAVAVLARRRGPAPFTAPRLAVLGQARLGGGAGISVVAAGDRRLLVGHGRDGVRLVADLGPLGESRP